MEAALAPGAVRCCEGGKAALGQAASAPDVEQQGGGWRAPMTMRRAGLFGNWDYGIARIHRDGRAMEEMRTALIFLPLLRPCIMRDAVNL